MLYYKHHLGKHSANVPHAERGDSTLDFSLVVKGIVHPRNENVVIIYPLLCRSKLCAFFFLLHTEEDIMKNVF